MVTSLDKLDWRIYRPICSIIDHVSIDHKDHIDPQPMFKFWNEPTVNYYIFVAF